MREKQQEWCFRIDQEMKACAISFFVTLTYSNENLVFADVEPCLNKRDLQLHFKKVRKALEPRSVKYYAVGEYGERSNPGRPHYHYLLFYYGQFERFKLMNIIKDNWDKGISQVLPVTGAQGYVTKYILKFDSRDHLVKPFSMISHGLGISYLTDEVLKYHHDNLINYGVKPGGFKVKLPRYYQDKIFSTYERLLIKKRSDMYRRKLEAKKLDCYEIQLANGLNPFKASIEAYQMRLYQSIQLFKTKKKI